MSGSAGLHVVLLAEDVPIPGFSGAGILTWGIITHLIDMGHRVTVLLLPSPYEYGPELRKDLALLGVSLMELRAEEVRSTRRTWREKLRYWLCPSVEDFYPVTELGPAIQAHVDRLRADVMLAFDFPAVAASRHVRGVPRLAAVGTWAPVFRYYRWRFMPHRWNLDYVKYSLWVFISFLQFARMKELLRGCQAKGHFAANYARWLSRHGVPGCQYYRTCLRDPVGHDWRRLRDEAERANRKPKIVMMGRVGTPMYLALRMLIREILPALERALGPEGFELHLIGSVEMPPELARRLTRPSVIHRGYVENLGPDLLSADVLLVPTPVVMSIRTRIITGLAHGCPIVTTRADAAAIPELVHGRNALIAEDGPDLVHQLLEALRDPLLRRRLGAGARETFETCFTAAVAGRQIEAELRRIAGRGSRAHSDMDAEMALSKVS